ncbi:hypothetical protein FRC03_004872 [Tulasnella sp. 419]|nr:hypothetical protein FRC03_004872 [Tulasnella sp. 419]
MATAQIALGRSGKKDVKSMLAAASDEIVGSSKSRNNDGAGPLSENPPMPYKAFTLSNALKGDT